MKVKIEIEYDDAEEDGTGQWSAFGAATNTGPSIRVVREGQLPHEGWFAYRGAVNGWKELVADVTAKAVDYIREEIPRDDR